MISRSKVVRRGKRWLSALPYFFPSRFFSRSSAVVTTWIYSGRQLALGALYTGSYSRQPSLPQRDRLNFPRSELRGFHRDRHLLRHHVGLASSPHLLAARFMKRDNTADISEAGKSCQTRVWIRSLEFIRVSRQRTDIMRISHFSFTNDEKIFYEVYFTLPSYDVSLMFVFGILYYSEYKILLIVQINYIIYFFPSFYTFLSKFEIFLNL